MFHFRPPGSPYHSHDTSFHWVGVQVENFFVTTPSNTGGLYNYILLSNSKIKWTGHSRQVNARMVVYKFETWSLILISMNNIAENEIIQPTFISYEIEVYKKYFLNSCSVGKSIMQDKRNMII